MSPSRFGVVCVGVAAFPLLAMATTWLGPQAVSQVSASAGSSPAATVGGTRDTYLAELTELYVGQGEAAVTDAMRSGRQLAPMHFLNRELERRGMKWRVRGTTGPLADTYDVS